MHKLKNTVKCGIFCLFSIFSVLFCHLSFTKLYYLLNNILYNLRIIVYMNTLLCYTNRGGFCFINAIYAIK